mmetsp:Transcript_31179/g.102829  ORF Transcript_31179/g.102829 Transcript_31179/m.102829 type:complete len:405 (+) Transcript_31179:1-1215(+)
MEEVFLRLSSHPAAVNRRLAHLDGGGLPPPITGRERRGGLGAAPLRRLAAASARRGSASRQASPPPRCGSLSSSGGGAAARRRLPSATVCRPPLLLLSLCGGAAAALARRLLVPTQRLVVGRTAGGQRTGGPASLRLRGRTPPRRRLAVQAVVRAAPEAGSLRQARPQGTLPAARAAGTARRAHHARPPPPRPARRAEDTARRLALHARRWAGLHPVPALASRLAPARRRPRGAERALSRPRARRFGGSLAAHARDVQPAREERPRGRPRPPGLPPAQRLRRGTRRDSPWRRATIASCGRPRAAPVQRRVAPGRRGEPEPSGRRHAAARWSRGGGQPHPRRRQLERRRPQWRRRGGRAGRAAAARQLGRLGSGRRAGRHPHRTATRQPHEPCRPGSPRRRPRRR